MAKKVTKIKKPDNVKIGFIKYDIIYDDEVSYIVDTYDPSTFGKIIPKEGKIYIHECESKSIEKSIVLHEILHGIDIMMGSDLEEDQIRVLTNGILTAVRENPGVFKYLFEEDK